MSDQAEVTYEVRELHPGYFTYDVHVRPVDGLAPIAQASGAFRDEARAELAAVTCVGLIGMRLGAMGAAPLPVRRIGDSPRARRLRRRAYATGRHAAFLSLGGGITLALHYLASVVW